MPAGPARAKKRRRSPAAPRALAHAVGQKKFLLTSKSHCFGRPLQRSPGFAALLAIGRDHFAVLSHLVHGLWKWPHPARRRVFPKPASTAQNALAGSAGVLAGCR